MGTQLHDIRPPRAFRWPKSLYHQMGELSWFRGKRVELIDGEIIQMAPMGTPHFSTLNIAQRALASAYGHSHFVSVQCPFNAGDNSEPEPDIAVIKGDARDFYDRLPSSAVLIVEIADSSLAYDRATKLAIYSRSMIPEYWIVNLVDHVIEVYAEPDGAGKFAAHKVFKLGDRLRLPGLPEAHLAVSDVNPWSI
jgi:Uma2 family endonuclease